MTGNLTVLLQYSVYISWHQWTVTCSCGYLFCYNQILSAAALRV